MHDAESMAQRSIQPHCQGGHNNEHISSPNQVHAACAGRGRGRCYTGRWGRMCRDDSDETIEIQDRQASERKITDNRAGKHDGHVQWNVESSIWWWESPKSKPCVQGAQPGCRANADRQKTLGSMKHLLNGGAFISCRDTRRLCRDSGGHRR